MQGVLLNKLYYLNLSFDVKLTNGFSNMQITKNSFAQKLNATQTFGRKQNIQFSILFFHSEFFSRLKALMKKSGLLKIPILKSANAFTYLVTPSWRPGVHFPSYF